MIKETSAVKFRQNPGEMLNQVECRHDSVLISKGGKPVAALVDARFDKICDRLEASFSDVPEDEGLAEIDEAVSGERAERIGNSKA